MNRAAAALAIALGAVLAGCHGKATPPTAPDDETHGAAAVAADETHGADAAESHGAAAVAADETHGAAAVDSPAVVPAATRQLLLGTFDAWDATAVTLSRWQRSARPGAAWTQVGDSWQAVLGVHGAAWGRGLHGAGAPAGESGPVKREGDGKSPAGVFALGDAFGYAAAPPAGARLPYRALTPDWKCIDDPRSRHYNQLLDTAGLAPDWSSFETMRRDDDLYRFGVFVDHNQRAAPGAGSCIFLHVWRAADRGTAGCTAMPRPRIASLVAWLDPAAHPVYALVPSARRAALAGAWGLPSAPPPPPPPAARSAPAPLTRNVPSLHTAQPSHGARVSWPGPPGSAPRVSRPGLGAPLRRFRGWNAPCNRPESSDAGRSHATSRHAGFEGEAMSITSITSRRSHRSPLAPVLHLGRRGHRRRGRRLTGQRLHHLGRREPARSRHPGRSRQRRAGRRALRPQHHRRAQEQDRRHDRRQRPPHLHAAHR